MSSVKAIPEGLKWVECERGIGGKNSPYVTFLSRIPCRMPSRRTKDHLFQVDSPQHGNELKVAVWASGTPEQFLLHVTIRDSRMQANGA
eukprot:CCRYP_019051-RA/>CCRYP_019051-RA protein AED:0.47 eAED:0.47 QI:0/-1/0/1/-1/1/1/0/88